MADTYDEIRKASCRLCELGFKVRPSVPRMHVDSPSGWIDRRCTAPTPEAVIEQQAATIAELRQAMQVGIGTAGRAIYHADRANTLEAEKSALLGHFRDLAKAIREWKDGAKRGTWAELCKAADALAALVPEDGR